MNFPTIFNRCMAITAAMLLSACASDGYSQFYKATPDGTPEEIAATRVAAPIGQPIVERASSGGPALTDSYIKRGYVLIGSSIFNTGRAETEEAAIQQGVKVGADLVLILDPRYTGSTTTAMPLTLPTATYGTSTTMVPITVNRTNYGAGYFIKRKWGFGATWRDLNDSERQELESNKGVCVQLVVDNTPAYTADILPGDIVLAVDGEPVLNTNSLIGLLRSRAGQAAPVKLSLYRRGTRLEKSVQLLPV